jgi:hypothetical protein
LAFSIIVSDSFKQLFLMMVEKLPIARSQLLKAKTNVNPQYFLAKNLQINIIRNSFEDNRS